MPYQHAVVRTLLTALTASLLALTASPVSALPYDCPGKDTPERAEYVCKMSSFVGPEYWNDWGGVKAKTIATYRQYTAKRASCHNTCSAKLTTCNNNCEQRCNSARCLATCTQKCSSRADRCNETCETKAHGTSIRTTIRKGKALAQSLQKECLRSANAQACEQQEAKPFCSTLQVPITAYLKNLRASGKELGKAVDSFVAMMNATHRALNSRISDLSNELKTKKYKCAAEDATAQNGQSGQNVSCILPQYKYNISAASLLNFDDYATPTTQAATTDNYDSLDPLLTLIGVTEKYCWNDEQCSDDYKLVQPYGPAQILNYFGMLAGKASALRPGSIVEIGGDRLTVKCVDQGAPNGGSTACRPGKGSPASFDIVIVEDNQRPTRTNPAGTCVVFNPR